MDDRVVPAEAYRLVDVAEPERLYRPEMRFAGDLAEHPGRADGEVPQRAELIRVIMSVGTPHRAMMTRSS